MTSQELPLAMTRSEDFGEQVMTKAVKAGRRTYFFNVRAAVHGLPIY